MHGTEVGIMNTNVEERRWPGFCATDQHRLVLVSIVGPVHKARVHKSTSIMQKRMI